MFGIVSINYICARTDLTHGGKESREVTDQRFVIGCAVVGSRCNPRTNLKFQAPCLAVLVRSKWRSGHPGTVSSAVPVQETQIPSAGPCFGCNMTTLRFLKGCHHQHVSRMVGSPRRTDCLAANCQSRARIDRWRIAMHQKESDIHSIPDRVTDGSEVGRCWSICEIKLSDLVTGIPFRTRSFRDVLKRSTSPTWSIYNTWRT